MAGLPYLTSRLRIYRGNDEAVEMINERDGEREYLDGLLQNSKTHSREELINAVLSCYSGKVYGDVNWRKVSGGWTTPAVPTIYGEFREKFEQLAQLSLDPGFITHLPEFIEFLKKKESDVQGYERVREEFKQYLGNRIVWRAMILSEEEVQKVTTEGIESRFLREKRWDAAIIEDFEANVLSTYFDELVEVHVCNENYLSPLVSVSSHEDVAITVGRSFGIKTIYPEEPRVLYLFKLSIPELDLIYHTDHGVKTPSFQQSVIESGTNLHITVDNRETSYPWGKEVESYILHKINPREIVEVSRPIVEKSSWNGKFTN